MATSFRHSRSRVWARRHPWTVRLVAALLVGAVAAPVALVLTGSSPRARHGSGAPRVPAGNGPFAVVSTTPAAGASVASDTVPTVRLSAAPDPHGPLPSLSPPVPGTWTASGTALVFRATAPFVPDSAETLTVPGGPAGVRDRAGATLSQPVTVAFRVAGSTLRLQQLLAQLGYLPVSFSPAGRPPSPAGMAQPQPGIFTWRWPDPLSGLEDHWAAGELGVLTQGAVMTFEDQHHMAVDGLVGPKVWSAVLQAAAAGEHDPKPYDYVFVDKTLPEHLVLYVDGVAKLPDVAVNTGIPGVDTPDGTYPVFEHLTASEMKGTNLDGTTYDDPNVPWASYFYNGDALHGFVRATYGSPQSNGCVEMSVADAGAVWPYTPIGTLVTVSGPAA